MVFSYYSVVGNVHGRMLFEFMANNCTINDTDKDGKPLGAEISWAEFEEDDKGLNVISTSSQYKAESSFLYMMYEQWDELPVLAEHTHSHHSVQSDPKYQHQLDPKMPNPGRSDIAASDQLKSKYAKKDKNIRPRFYVYYRGFYSRY